MIRVSPIPNQPFGATVTGVDLSAPLSQQQRATLRNAWLEHQVISFPDQPLTHRQFEAASKAFGDFGDEPYLRGLPDHPYIVAVERKADEKPAPFLSLIHI